MSDVGVISRGQQKATIVDAGEDGLLMAGLCRRDMRAFETLYRTYHRRLVRFLLNITHRPTIVEEVLNDTMMAVWEKPEAYRGASRLSTWIMAIAYRKAMRALRRQDLPVEEGPPAAAGAEAAPDRDIGRARVNRLLLDAMGQLSPDHRAVIDLTYFHELGYREIAEIMDCPVDTVKTRMFHARRNLRRLLAGSAADWF
ncbi:MAG TPA: RNA polymerase sigma factor [Sphingomonas sp.]|nr:RNA polymerase sigma factor [Sphingomonas sp.]